MSDINKIELPSCTTYNIYEPINYMGIFVVFDEMGRAMFVGRSGNKSIGEVIERMRMAYWMRQPTAEIIRAFKEHDLEQQKYAEQILKLSVDPLIIESADYNEAIKNG